jgi:SAM-dependent methyltransferase
VGLLAPVAEFLLREHAYKAIDGDVLFVGRQTTFLDERSLSQLLRRHGMAAPEGIEVEIDTFTRGAQGRRLITDRYFMKALGVQDVKFMDVSNYEGVDIIHDLGQPIDSTLHEKFDFIYNGGCFDNMFNPGVAIINLSKMLKPGGRIVCLESASSWNSPYLVFSPGWFFDYYATNGFVDCKVYVASYRNNDQLFFGPWELFYFDWRFDKNGSLPEALPGTHLIVVVVAEKASDSTSDRQPIQHQYRVDPGPSRDFDRGLQRFARSRRPVVLSGEISAASKGFEGAIDPAAPRGAQRQWRRIRSRLRRAIDSILPEDPRTRYQDYRQLRRLGRFGEGLSEGR